MKDDQLDHIIKAKLQNLQVNLRPTDWEAFAEKLNQATGGVAGVDDLEFDQLVKSKLQNFQADQAAMGWVAFEEKLDQSNGSVTSTNDQEFDQVIFNRLNQFKASGIKKEQHWALLERQLQQLAGFRERLLQYKLIEAILVSLLLLITVELGFPSLNSSPISSKNTAENLSAAPISESRSLEKDQTSITKNRDPLSTDTNTTEESSVSLTNQTTKNTGISIEMSQQASPSIFSQIETLHRTDQSLKHSLDPATLQPKINGSGMEQTSRMGPLALVPGKKTRLSTHQEPEMVHKITPTSRLNVQISMLGGADYNRVMTPENTNRSVKAFDRYSLGYRGGLLLDMGRADSRLRMGSGFIYTAKQYEVGLERIQGSLLLRGGWTAESLENIELNMINLPVFARYDVLQSKRWSVFAHAGVAMQVALQANYYVGYPDNLPQPIGINQTPSRESRIQDQTGGFLEGGSFKENSFFTGNMGLGLERRVADRWSLFMQSKYEYSIGYLSAGLGPTQDRINTMSFESGIRVKLK